jgi:hypothetical protein
MCLAVAAPASLRRLPIARPFEYMRRIFSEEVMMPRFEVVVAACARMNFEQTIIVDARSRENAEDKAIEIANTIDDWQPAGTPAFDDDFQIREPVEKVNKMIPLTREKPKKRAAIAQKKS